MLLPPLVLVFAGIAGLAALHLAKLHARRLWMKTAVLALPAGWYLGTLYFYDASIRPGECLELAMFYGLFLLPVVFLDPKGWAASARAKRFFIYSILTAFASYLLLLGYGISMAPKPSWSVERLVEAMQSDWPEVSERASYMLTDPEESGSFILTRMGPGPTAQEALPVVTAALQKSGLRGRRRLIRLLGYYGAAASSAVPELKKHLSDENQDVRSAAARSLGRIKKDANQPSGG
ncbi:MAG: HEAT repeat domain-containing protein [Elusimicrobiota bacterium]